MKKIAALVLVAGSAALAQDSLSVGNVSTSNGSPTNALLPGEKVSFSVLTNWGSPGIGFAGFEGGMSSSGGAFTAASNGALDPNFYVAPGGLGTSTISGLVVGQLPQIINPNFVTANPVELFKAEWTAPAAAGTYTYTTATKQYSVYINNSASRTGTPTEASGSFTVIPAPSALALLGLGGLVAGRRRR